MDSKGRITLVLCWEGAGTPHPTTGHALTHDSGAVSLTSRQSSSTAGSTIASGGPHHPQRALLGKERNLAAVK